MKQFPATKSILKVMLPFLLALDGAARVNDSSKATACSYHQAVPQFLNAPHPTTYVIAVALRKAADEKRLTLIKPQQSAKGYYTAIGKLEAFTQRLNRTIQDSYPHNHSLGLSVVFVDVTLWSRIVIKDRKLTLQPHVAGAKSGDVVISTAESVLAAMLHGKLSFQEALSRGLIHIEGPDSKVFFVKQIMTSSIRSTRRTATLPTPSVEPTLNQNASVAVTPRNQ